MSTTQKTIATLVLVTGILYFMFQKPKEDKKWFHDTKFNFVSWYMTNNLGEFTKVDLANERLNSERALINDFLLSIELQFKTMLWDGSVMTVFYEGNKKSETNRKALIEYLPQLDLVKLSNESAEDSRKADKRVYDEYIGDW